MIKTTCPNCGALVTIDEEGYAEIVRQVRGDEFNKELQERIEAEKKNWEDKHSREKERAVENAVSEVKSDLENKLKEANQKITEKEKEIIQKNGQFATLKEQHERNLEKVAAEKDKQIAALQSTISINEANHKRELKEEVSKIETKLNENETAHRVTLAKKDAEIDQLRLNKPQSTKEIGEDLEQYCLNEFNLHLAPIVPNASFKKDNETNRGSKGDFIYREYDENGIEFISIMFEMKNESKESKTNQKNDKFFDKLDKDRKKKGCEYAILVSTLEEGTKNSVYDQGIYEVPYSTYGFEKMYVIRPWLFIQMIRLLRNMALDSLKVKRELKLAQDQNNDMTHFRENLAEISKGIHENYRSAGEYFRNAIKKIDKSIAFLEDTKKALKSFEDELLQAKNKADGLTVENLTREIPTMIEMFKALPDRSET